MPRRRVAAAAEKVGDEQTKPVETRRMVTLRHSAVVLGNDDRHALSAAANAGERHDTRSRDPKNARMSSSRPPRTAP
jgi:hypothetical protein